ncbi:MAG TPA: hypothetical protein VF431_01165, partial [Candidatus Methylomirabilis sp.]
MPKECAHPDASISRLPKHPLFGRLLKIDLLSWAAYAPGMDTKQLHAAEQRLANFLSEVVPHMG